MKREERRRAESDGDLSDAFWTEEERPESAQQPVALQQPLSGDGVHFGASPFAPGVLAFSRILNNQEILVVANASTQSDFHGRILVDFFINYDGERYRVLNNPGVLVAGPVETRSGLEIHELDGGLTTGPARMIEVSLRPMEVQILAK